MSLLEWLSSEAVLASVEVKAKSESSKSAVRCLMSISPSSGRARDDGLRVASAPVLFVADLLHPVGVLAIEQLGDGDMGHRGRRRCSMPMLKPRRKPDDIAG